MKIPALARGLEILDYMVKSGSAKRYGDISKHFGDISDASLNRLLKSLMSSGFIEKDVNRKYCITDRVRGWKQYLGGDISFRKIIAPHVESLASKVNESTSFAIYTEERIEILCRTNMIDSFAIVPDGSIIDFELDHAAVLAILPNLNEKEFNKAINSSISSITSRDEFYKTVSGARTGEVYIDTPSTRLGMKRMAVPIKLPQLTGALFICAPTQRIENQFELYREHLLDCRNNIQIHL